MSSRAARQLAAQILDACRDRSLTVTVAESCTGGLIAGALTSVAGSSEVFERGFVTYTNRAKTELLGIPRTLLDRAGAVSEEVARAMAEGALAAAPVDLALAVTGIAGPGGGTALKPVGLVHMACARRDAGTVHESDRFGGDRDAVRAATVVTALRLLLDRVGEEKDYS